jgi:hypothetical protein
MSGKQLIGIVAQVLSGLAIFATTSPPALADTTTLICHMDMQFIIEEDTTTIELNQAASTVVVHWAGYHSTDNVTTGSARTGGPYQAVYGKDTITFSSSDGNTNLSYVLNRLTGSLEIKPINWKYACQVAKPQF